MVHYSIFETRPPLTVGVRGHDLSPAVLLHYLRGLVSGMVVCVTLHRIRRVSLLNYLSSQVVGLPGAVEGVGS